MTLLELHPKRILSLSRGKFKGVCSPFRLNRRFFLAEYARQNDLLLCFCLWGTAEILRFAQDDTSCRFERGTLPLSIE